MTVFMDNIYHMDVQNDLFTLLFLDSIFVASSHVIIWAMYPELR